MRCREVGGCVERYDDEERLKLTLEIGTVKMDLV